MKFLALFFLLVLPLCANPNIEIVSKTGKSMKGCLIAVAEPDYEFDVSIGKRRKRQKTSYRMMNMEITSKVTARNKDSVLASPGMKGRLIFVGEQQGKENVFEILGVADFEMAPDAAKTATFETKPFVTEYDNKKGSYGYFGGKDFAGYVLLMADKKGEVFFTKTLNKDFKAALESEADLIEDLLKIQKATLVGKNLRPL